MTLPKHYGLTDLTIGEAKILMKEFITYSFFSLLLFGLPYALFMGLFWGAESIVPKEQFSWLSRGLSLGLIIFVVVLLIRDPPYTLKYFGDLFLSLSVALAGVSRAKQVIGLCFIIGYFYAAIKFPTVWFWFSIVVFVPAAFTYDRYKQFLKLKAEEASHATQDRTA